MRTVGYGGMGVAGRLPTELAAVASPSRKHTATRELVASVDAVHALDSALRCAQARVSLWRVFEQEAQ